jgi:HK97 gp10 family phage protein
MSTAVELAEHTLELARGHVALELESCEALAVHLVASVAAWKLARRHALNEAAKLIKVDARKQIGEYQPAVGEYPEWAELAESTEDEKARVGAPPDAPLLRFGDLKKSFRSTIVNDDEVIVGSTDPVMEFHEFGTSKMPPRPVLGPAFVKNEVKIQALMGGAILEAVLVGQRLGYRLSTGGEHYGADSAEEQHSERDEG